MKFSNSKLNVKRLLISLLVLTACVIIAMFAGIKQGSAFAQSSENEYSATESAVQARTNKPAGVSLASDNSIITQDTAQTNLGLSINLVTNREADLTELKDGSPIFNHDWLDSKIEKANQINVSYSNSEFFSASDFESISNQISASFGISSSISAGISVFKAEASSGFKITGAMNYSKYASQKYNVFKSEIQRYTLSLPNYSSNLTEYKDNLHQDYLNALDELFSGRLDYTQFFDTYGTHVIGKGIYGGKLSLYYSAVSNKYDVGNTLSAEIDNKFETSVAGVLSGSTSVSFSAQSMFNSSASEIREATVISAAGGNSFSGTTINGFAQNYKSWSNSVSSNPVLIGFSSDGLIPLWNLLPVKYSSKSDTLKSWFISYANEKSSDIVSNYKSPLEDVDDLKYTYNRAEEWKISDSGPMNQKHDDLILNDIFGYSYEVLKNYGFKNIEVDVSLSMKEKNKGYQHVYLYNEISDVYKQGWLQTKTIEYGGTSLKKTYGIQQFSFDTRSLDEFKDESKSYCILLKPVVIRYGATGTGEDTWYNKNCSVSVVISK